MVNNARIMRRSLALLLMLVSHQLIIVNAATSSSTSSKKGLEGKIKHVIVLMEENRSFDHFFGWYPGVNGLTGKEFNLVNQSNPTGARVYVDKRATNIAPCDPDHSTPGTAYKIYGYENYSGNHTANATMGGFVEWENKRGNERTNYCAVMSTFTPADLPVMTALADEFVLMDRFFCAHPGPTWPNRLYMLSGTSAGLTETGPWFQNQVGQLFPQRTIFDQLESEGMTWKNYFNDTPWELMLATLAHNPHNLQPMEQFWVDAATGNLPNFAWINPRSGINITTNEGCNDDHPDHDVALGERYYKDIYEALRASPQWNETLFIITFDEHGGFYDHVPPPVNVPPPGDNIPSYPDRNCSFDRLGVRIPTLLISPWLPKGLVLSEPPAAQKPAPNSEYSLTSIIATTRKLLGMKSPPLTKRDAWSATFEQVFSETKPRTDCPHTLPNAPAPSVHYSPELEAKLPINGLQEYIMTLHANVMGENFPSHIMYQGQVAEWNQQKFQQHTEITNKWKDSKTQQQWKHGDSNSTAPLVVIAGPDGLPFWISKDFNINQNASTRYVTISILSKLCLDYNITTMTIGVSVCYPSVFPATNRDPAQQWVWNPDATVRPYAYPSLCLATTYLSGDPRFYLQACDIDEVSQHFAWNGGEIPAIGEASGSIGFGVGSVGLVNASSLHDYYYY